MVFSNFFKIVNYQAPNGAIVVSIVSCAALVLTTTLLFQRLTDFIILSIFYSVKSVVVKFGIPFCGNVATKFVHNFYSHPGYVPILLKNTVTLENFC